MSFFAELKRRNVIRVGLAYIIVSWVLAQIAEFAFENFGAPDWVLKSVVVVMLLGLPIALIFAWAFEMTPGGIKREKDVDRTQSIMPKTGRKLDRMIIGVLTLVIVWFLIDEYKGSGSIPSEAAKTHQSSPPGELNLTPAEVVRTCVLAGRDPALREQLLVQLNQFIESVEGSADIRQLAACLAFAGQADCAAELALSDIGDNWPDIVGFWATNEPTGAMRQTRVLREQLLDMGLVDFYREHGWPDLCHPLGEDDFECDP